MPNASPLPSLAVCFSPALLPAHNVKHALVVVIDILRATTSICACLYNGAISVIPVTSVSHCLLFSPDEYLFAAERNGKKVEGFRFGNSPLEFTPELVRGKKIVMSATNGTKAIAAAKKAKQVIIGAFANFSLLIQYLQAQKLPTYLLCSGWKGEICLEDAFFAGAVCQKLQEQFHFTNDAAYIALELFKTGKEKQDFLPKAASHFTRLKVLQKENDIAQCLSLDSYPVLPFLNAAGELKPLPC
jgi:2-phosphosulfolactate phosphatase